MKAISPKIVVVLGLNKQAGIPVYIVRATAIVNAMEANPKLFPSPIPSFAQVKADITALTDAETAYKSHLGTKAVRDDKHAVVIADMSQLHAYVLQIATASPSQALIIADAASMTVPRPPTPRHKSDLSVKQTVSGVVHMVAKATKGAKANNWQYSSDGGKTWIDLPETTRAQATVQNLTSGATVLFRQRALTKAGLTDWCSPVTHVVS
jgi:hypothetical protein